MLNRNIVVFGASGGGSKVERMLADMGYMVHGFVDNSPRKKDTKIDGLPVTMPDSLSEHDHAIIIASVWEEEIRQQLIKAGYADRIVGKEEYMYEYAREHTQEYAYIRDAQIGSVCGEKPTYIFGLDFGLFNGGVESWVYVITDALRARGYRVVFLTLNFTKFIPERFKEITYCMDINGPHYIETMNQIIDIILKHSPAVLIDSWQNMSMLAGVLIKMHRQDALKCMLEVVHNDLPRLFRVIGRFEEHIDYCMGVCRDLSSAIARAGVINPDKVVYKESPVKYGQSRAGYTTDESRPLRIGYAARLVRSQKRADLLIPLIDKLSERNVNFYLEIAGEGEVYPALNHYISEHALQEKVRLMGLLPREKMNSFWSGQDVFINLSEYEGVGLSMLEAMGNGCVPIVTAVAGSTEFVQEDIGYVCPIGDIEEIARKIDELSRHRERLPEMGMRAQERTRKKCSVESYIDFLLRYTANAE